MLSLVRRRTTAAAPYAPAAKRPFALTLDQQFLYPSRSHVQVLTDVRRALQQREGLVVVTGGPGTGKTLLCRALLSELGAGACVSVVLDPRVTVEDLLLHVLADFGAISSPRQLAATGSPTRHQLMRALQQFLASLIPIWGCAVLVIDEAQDLDPAVLEQLRLLLNFETEEAKLLQIVLIGQPRLQGVLQAPSLQQLDARVARRCVLEPLDGDEVGKYIDHRLHMARHLPTPSDVITIDADTPGSSGLYHALSFTPAAVRSIAQRSQGVPRAINVLCDRAIEIAIDRGSPCVDWRIARAAATRIQSPGFSRQHGWPASRRRMATAAAVTAALGLGGWSLRGGSPAPVVPAPPVVFAAASASLALNESFDVKPLQVAGSYNVRVGSFRWAASAMELTEKLQATGLPAFTLVEERGMHQVIVGPYLSEAEIMAVVRRLAGNGFASRDVFVEYFEADAEGGAVSREQREAQLRRPGTRP